MNEKIMNIWIIYETKMKDERERGGRADLSEECIPINVCILSNVGDDRFFS